MDEYGDGLPVVLDSRCHPPCGAPVDIEPTAGLVDVRVLPRHPVTQRQAGIAQGPGQLRL
ncbi:hypothetical protein [Streptomyces sp. NBC_00203]|uniref:hypothetical protein n=1 Tax=Streptomyces sp. NBC_00203 TaxID=2975680 RepID=UPI0032462DE9